MPIATTCSSGHAFKVKDELAGKKIRCPKCGVTVQLPDRQPATQPVVTPPTHAATAVDAAVPNPNDDLVVAELVVPSPSRSRPSATTRSSNVTSSNKPSPPPPKPEIISLDLVELDDVATDQPVEILVEDDSFASEPVVPVAQSAPRSLAPSVSTSSPGKALSPTKAPAAVKAPSATRPAPAPLSNGLTAEAIKIVTIYGGSSLAVGFLGVLMLGLYFMGGPNQPENNLVAAGTPSNSTLATPSPSTSSNTSSSSALPSSITSPVEPEPAPTVAASSNVSPLASSDATAPVETSRSTSAVSNTKVGAGNRSTVKSVAPAANASPYGLNVAQISDPARAFDIPFEVETTWYDETQGRYIIGHATEGLIVYNVDDLVAGNAAPSKIVSLGGDKPVSICSKQVAGQWLLIVATENNSNLSVFDAALKPQNPIELLELSQIAYIASSRFDKDTRLYVCTRGSSRDDSTLSFYDFQTKSITTLPEVRCDMLTVSPDGRWLSCNHLGTTELFRRTASKLVSVNSRFSDKENGRFVNDRFTYANKVCTIDGLVTLNQLNGHYYNEFAKKPVGFCWELKKLSFVSSNDYRVLTEIRLPESWGSYLPPRPVGGKFPSAYGTGELHADDSRLIVLGRVSKKLFLANLADLQLPDEPDLRPTGTINDMVPVGQPWTATLGLPSDTELKTVQSKCDVEPPEDQRMFRIAGGTQSGISTRLLAPIGERDRQITLKLDNELRSRPTPFTIYIDAEPVTVVNLQVGQIVLTDDERITGMIAHVSRSQGSRHTTDAVIGLEASRAAPNPSALPVVSADKVSWQPEVGTFGVYYVRLQASKDGVTRQYLQRVDFTLPKRELPFVIYGLSVDRDHETAIVWGRSSTGNDSKGKFHVALVDLTGKVEPRIVDIPQAILWGCIDKRAFYLAVEDKDRLKPSYLDQGYSSRERTEVQAYDVNKLTLTKKVVAPVPVERMESLAGKYLILNEHQAMTLPDLKEVPIRDPTRPVMHGRVGDGWLYNGVLYDKDLVKPQLLVQPLFTSTWNSPGSTRPFIAPSGQYSTIADRIGGPQLQLMTGSYGSSRELGTSLSRFAGRVRMESGWVQFIPWQTVDQRYLSIRDSADNVGYLFTKRPESGSAGLDSWRSPISASNEHFVCGYWNELCIAPLELVLPKTETFQFEQKQSKFVLNATKSNTLNFSVDNAVKYKLAFFHKPYGSPLLSLESNDGKFEVDFPLDPLREAAIFELQRFANDSGSNRNATPNTTDPRAYQKMISEATETFVKKFSGVGIPIYACVLAHHKDGIQQCVLTHYYFVDVPTSILQSRPGALQPNRNPN